MKNLLNKKMMDKSVAVLLAAGLALTFSACSTEGENTTTSGEGSLAGSSEGISSLVPNEYKDNGVKIAAYNDWAPAEFLDEDGELVGWSVDLAHAMAKILGVDITITGTTFDAIIPGLQSKKFDAGFASFGPTDERLQVLDMVGEVVDGTAYASLKKNNLVVSETQDLCGRSVGVIVGAFDFQYLTKQNTEVCDAEGLENIQLDQYKTQADAQLAMSSGRVDFVAAGSQKLQYLALQRDEVAISDLVSNPVYNCIGIRKGDPLGTAMNEAVQQLIDNGKYEEILNKWGITSGLMNKGVFITSDNPNPELPKA
jgi:polar amino acid transport system substrate-binding protein